jgi:two-component system chemotaxis response regulator CheY
VLIADDHAGFRRMVREALEAEGLAVAGEAGTGRAALDLVAAAGPGAVLLDIRLPDIDGFAVCRAIRARWPHVRVVLCSVSPIADYGPCYAESGAHGFVAKHECTGPRLALMLGPAGPASA